MDEQTELDFNTCICVIKEAQQEGLLTEVIVWALKEMKQNPSLTIAQALEYGFYEWIK